MAHLNHEDRREWQKANRNTVKGRANSLCCGARARAKRKGMEFDLDTAWVLEGLLVGCAMTGLSFNYNPTDKYASPLSPSIDRINAGGPYTKDNCRVILWAVNSGMSTWGKDTYLEIAKAVENF